MSAGRLRSIGLPQANALLLLSEVFEAWFRFGAATPQGTQCRDDARKPAANDRANDEAAEEANGTARRKDGERTGFVHACLFLTHSR